jgi:hypothetical protein
VAATEQAPRVRTAATTESILGNVEAETALNGANQSLLCISVVALSLKSQEHGETEFEIGR